MTIIDIIVRHDESGGGAGGEWRGEGWGEGRGWGEKRRGRPGVEVKSPLMAGDALMREHRPIDLKHVRADSVCFD